MSDQTPSLGNTGFVAGGVGGIVSINGDLTPAQVLAAGAGISVTPGPAGTHTIANTASGSLVSINGDLTPAQVLAVGAGISLTPGPAGTNTLVNTDPGSAVPPFIAGTPGIVSDPGAALVTDYLGADNTFRPVPGGIASINADATAAQVLAAGAGISITPGPAGTNTIANTAAGSLISINGDITPAQILAVGAGLSITPGPAGTHTLVNILPSKIQSLNADITAAQTLTGLGGVAVVNNGVGGHTIEGPTSTAYGSAVGGGAVLPNGVPVNLITIVIPISGTYIISWKAGLNGVAGQRMDVWLKINGASVLPFAFSGMIEIAGQTLQVNGTEGTAITAGDTLALTIDHHGGGAGTTATAAFLDAFRIL